MLCGEQQRADPVSVQRTRQARKYEQCCSVLQVVSCSGNQIPNDGDNYSCVAENPVDKKATELHVEDTCLRDRGMIMKHRNTLIIIPLMLFTVLQKTN